MPLGPRLLRRAKTAVVAEEKLREAMPRPEKIDPDVFANTGIGMRLLPCSKI